jgi:hypothetical protein
MSTLTESALSGSPTWDLYDLSIDNPEHEFYDSTIVEHNDISGFRIAYYILKTDGYDKLYGENPNESFEEPKFTKVSYAPGREDLIVQSFGMSMDDTIQYAMIPKTTFTRDVTSASDPKVGDVIKVGFNNRNYEITYVSQEQKIFQGKKFSWEFVLRPFRFSEQSSSHQRIETGSTIEDVFSTSAVDFDSTLFNTISGGMSPLAGVETLHPFGDNEFIETESKKIFDNTKLTTDDYIYTNFGRKKVE